MERFFINQKNNNVVVIGGVRVLSEFSPEQVVVGVAGAQVVINGERLRIASFDENEINVSGKIINIETVKRGTHSV